MHLFHNMILLIGVFALILGVNGENDCDIISPYQKCLHHVPREKLERIHVMPDKDELMDICPDQLQYFQCFIDHIDDCGRMSEHFIVIEFMENSYEIAKDLCDEDSELHAGYAASAECYKTLEGQGKACEMEAKDIYNAYFEHIKKAHPERVEAVHKSSQQMCMIESYKLACLSEKVLKECGEIAQSTMMEVISRSQYLRQFCSRSMVDELKTDFLDFVDMEDDDLEIYRNAFYSMKK